MFKKLALSLAAVAVCGVAGAEDVFANATEYFVNPDPAVGSNDYDGTSPTNVPGTTKGPKLWIQNAVDLIKNDDGAIVTLAPGVYTNGYKIGSTKDNASNRVVIARSNVKLRGTAGHRDDTFIVGKFDWESGDAYGRGPAAARCVWGPGTDKNVIVEGVTLTGGASPTDDPLDGNRDRGGAAKNIILVDCVVSNNAAVRGGGLYQGKAYRCRFYDNYASSGGSVACWSSLSTSLCVRNRGNTLLAYCNYLVNCTIADNQPTGAALGQSPASGITNPGTHAYNTLLINNYGGNGFSRFSDATTSSTANACVARNGILSAAEGGVDDASVTNAISEFAELVCPGLSDCRILTTSSSYNRGEGSYVDNADILPFPEGYEPKDIDGNPIPTSGKIHVGCSQTAVAPAGAPFEFRQGCDILGYGQLGCHRGRYTGCYEYLRPLVTGEIFRVRPVLEAGERLYALYDTNAPDVDNVPAGGYTSVYALYDGTYCLPARPLSLGRSVRVRDIAVEATLYVDGTNGNDDWDGTSATFVSGTTGPTKTIKAAVALRAAISKNSHVIIYVAPGEYTETSGASQAAVCLAVNNTALISTKQGGATIYGSKDPETATGLGEGALRCVALNGSESFLQGFVLSGGYGPSTTAGAAYACGGVLCAANPVRQAVLDCVITNCTASTGAAMFRGRAFRTAFYNNTSTAGSIVWMTHCYSCLFAGNVIEDGKSTVLYDRANAYFCTLAAEDQNPWDVSVSNLVGVIAVDAASSKVPKGVKTGVVLNGDACVADPAGHDFRLGCLSAAYGAVPVEDCIDLDTYILMTTDFNGKDLQLVNGKYTAGAIRNDPLPCVVIAQDGSEGTTVTGGHVGTNVVTEAGQTFTVTTDATRPLIGIRKAGEIVSRATSYVIPTEGVTSSVVYDVLYGTDWYVDQKNGSDANGGGSLENAKKKLTTAATLAADGDTVKVAPGTYDDEDGTMIQSAKISAAPFTMPSRVVVKSGVTVESLEGPEKTVILGKQTAGEGKYGLGDDSIRCVVLAENAKIKGFTLTGGGTRVHVPTAKGGDNYADDYTGGAVLGDSYDTSVVEDCIVTNNCAGNCGVGFNVRCIRSILVDNLASNRCSCVRQGRFVGCLIDRNRGINAIEHFFEFDSCTVGPDNHNKLNGTGAPSMLQYPRDGMAVKNSVILQTSNVYNGKTSGYPAAASNTVFVSGSGPTASNWTVDGKTQFISSKTIMDWFDSDLRPLLLSGSPVLDKVDAESAALSDAEAVGSWDATGLQRVMNGCRDIGALEADWRANYAAAIKNSSRFAVTNASPDVIRESPTAGEVRIHDGAALAATWQTFAVGDKYRLIVQVTGTGTLTVTQNNEVVGTATAAEGEKTLILASGALTDSLRFSYAGDDGYGVVRRIASARGFAIFFR